jgi:hypothetical protein
LVAESCHNGVTTHIVKLAERLIGVGAAVDRHKKEESNILWTFGSFADISGGMGGHGDHKVTISDPGPHLR